MNQDLENSRDEITAISNRLQARCPKIGDLAHRAILENWGVEQFRARALEMLPEAQPLSRPTAAIPAREWNRYSITRALCCIAENRAIDGFEREVSDEISRQSRQKPRGLWVPDEALAMQQRNFVAGTGTLGGFLVETQNLGDQFIGLLRNRARVIQAGARVIQLSSPVTIPRQSAAGETNWVGETVAATLSTGNFTQITLTPNAVSAFQQYGKQLLMESNPSIDMLIRDDIMQQLGLAVDLACLHGTGSGQPTGIANTTGIGTVNLATNGLAMNNSTAYPALVSLETVVASGNGDVENMGYLMRAGIRGALKTTTKFASAGDSTVWEAKPGPDGRMTNSVNGYAAMVTQQISANLTTGTATTITTPVFFGDWNQLIVANFGATDLIVDPYTLAQNAVVRVIARRWVDCGVRTPASFALLGGSLTT